MGKSQLCVRPWLLITILNFSIRGLTDKGILMFLFLLVAETKIGGKETKEPG